MKPRCPQCKKIITIPDEYKGRQINCPNCNEPVIAEKKPVHKILLEDVPAINPGRPGDKYQNIAAIGIVFGSATAILTQQTAEVFLCIIGFLMIFVLGSILNRLERIAHAAENNQK